MARTALLVLGGYGVVVLILALGGLVASPGRLGATASVRLLALVALVAVLQAVLRQVAAHVALEGRRQLSQEAITYWRDMLVRLIAAGGTTFVLMVGWLLSGIADIDLGPGAAPASRARAVLFLAMGLPWWVGWYVASLALADALEPYRTTARDGVASTLIPVGYVRWVFVTPVFCAAVALCVYACIDNGLGWA